MIGLPAASRSGDVLTVLDAAPSPVVAVDARGRIDYVNSRALAAFGYRRSELLGRPVELLLPVEIVAEHEFLRTQYGARPHPRPTPDGAELQARRKDGSLFPVEVSLTPVGSGADLWVVATLRDLSERLSIEQQMRDLSRVYLTLAQTNQAIVRATDEAALYDEVCRIAVDHGGYLGAWVGEPDGERVRRVASAGSLDDYVDRLDISLDRAAEHGNGPTALALREGSAYFSGDFATDARTRPWHALAAEYGIRASATVPIRCEGRVVAVLTFYSEVVHVFDEHMRSLLERMADNVSVALDAFSARRRLERVAAERADLMARLVDAQEDERTRIAADVHDDSVQSLAAVDLRLGLLQRRAAEEAPALLPALQRLQDDVQHVVGGLRDLLFDLEPADLDAPMPALLEDVAGHVFEHAGVRWSIVVDGDVPVAGHLLTPSACGQALRIAKEALINVRKHAEASSVLVTVRPDPDGVEVTVTDDGRGIDPHATPRPGHRGVATMVDRACVLGGWVRVEPADPTGTTVRFWLPSTTSTAALGQDPPPGPDLAGPPDRTVVG